MRYALIMAGGSGTRLWPLSHQGEPKQLLEIIDGKSLLRLAYERVAGMLPPQRILVCAGASYLDVVAKQLPEVPADNLLGEPVGRDSLNAAAWPAAVLVQRDPQAVMAVLTADQVIEPVDRFRAALEDAYRLAEQDAGALVTFGIVPSSPHTGYGYLQRGADLPGFERASEVLQFKEKPDLQTATGYLESGQYWWNAGMFVWRAATLLDQCRVLQPDTWSAVLELAAHPGSLGAVYPNLQKVSIDYAVMEPVSQGLSSGHVVAVGLDVQWADVGSFQALRDYLASVPGAARPDDNVSQGPAVQVDSSGNLLINTCGAGSVLAVAGLHDMVVVRTPTASLVVPLEASQLVKELAGRVAVEVDPELA